MRVTQPGRRHVAGSLVALGLAITYGMALLGASNAAANAKRVPSAPVVIKNPTNVSGQVKQKVHFSARATGFPKPKVQWQLSTDGVNFVAIRGARTRGLGFRAKASESGNEYRAVFSNAYGTATTSPAILTVVVTPTLKCSGIPHIGIDLSGCDLSGANLSGINLTGANFSNANLTLANLSGSILTNANLNGARLVGANLSSAQLPGANLSNFNLTAVDLSGVNLTNANLTGTIFTGATLNSADFSGATLVRQDFSNMLVPAVNFSNADLSGAVMVNTNFCSGCMFGSDFSGADLTNVDFTNAFLDMSHLVGSNVSGANFAGASLNEVRSGGMTGLPSSLPIGYGLVDGYLFGPNEVITNANLSGIALRGLNLFQDIFDHSNFTGADLSATNLNGASLNTADLTNANLSNAQLVNGNLYHAIVTNADLTRITWGNTLCPDGTNSDSDSGTCLNNLG